MAHNNSFDQNHDRHLVLSHNLLKLLAWIVDHEAETLKQLVARAIQQGFASSYKLDDDAVELHLSDETLQQSVIEFLGLMDTLLMEATHENSATRFLQRNMIPVLDHLDATICDDQIVQASIERASNKLESNPNANLQELMLQELLKRWKPDKKQTSN